MISAFKRLNVMSSSSSSAKESSSQKKPLIPPRPPQKMNPKTVSPTSKQESPLLPPPPPPMRPMNKRSRSMPVRFTFSKEDIEWSQRCSTILESPPPAKKRRQLLPTVIYETDVYEPASEKAKLPSGCVLEHFTFESAEYNNEVKANIYRNCTLVRYVAGIGKPGTTVPVIGVEAAKSRITYFTSDNRQWRAKMGVKIYDCVLVGQ